MTSKPVQANADNFLSATGQEETLCPCVYVHVCACEFVRGGTCTLARMYACGTTQMLLQRKTKRELAISTITGTSFTNFFARV